jgi:hypothetical protein
MVSLYLEGPLYLYYSAGLSLVAVLWWTPPGKWPRATTAAVVVLLAVVAVCSHAGQTRLRSASDILSGRTITDVWSDRPDAALPRASLIIDPQDQRSFERTVQFIRNHTMPREAIWVFPNDAELYFLAERRNPLRFYNAALGLRNDSDVDRLLNRLATDPPRVVVFRPGDKYDTAFVATVMNTVRQRAVQVTRLEGLELYVL